MSSEQKYPELVKFAEHQQQISDLVGFIEHLYSQGYEFGRWGDSQIRLDPVTLSESALEAHAADFVGIDMSKVNAERAKLITAAQQEQKS